jgi:hypothetical protein
MGVGANELSIAAPPKYCRSKFAAALRSNLKRRPWRDAWRRLAPPILALYAMRRNYSSNNAIMHNNSALIINRAVFPVLAMLLVTVMSCHQADTPPVQSQENATNKNAQGSIIADVPLNIAPNADYLFFLHAKIVEDQGRRPTSPKYGVYEYEEILKTFKNKGFVVISEARPKDTAPEPYVAKLIGQINILLKAGVPPQKITVLGASKGAVIAMITSSRLKNKDVNFVIMSNCNDWVDKNFNIDLHGNILSIYDINDEFGQSCQKFFDKATGLNRRLEIELKIGAGHGVLFKPLKEWVEPVIEWARPSRK